MINHNDQALSTSSLSTSSWSFSKTMNRSSIHTTCSALGIVHSTDACLVLKWLLVGSSLQRKTGWNYSWQKSDPPTPISQRQTLCYIVVHINSTFIPDFLTISGARGPNPMEHKDAMEAGSLCEEKSIMDLSPLKIVTVNCQSFIFCFIGWLRCGRSPELRYVPTQDYQGLPQQKVRDKCFSTLWLWAPAF